MTWTAIRLFLTGAFGKAWAWLTASSVHILIACLGASLAWGYVGHHNAAKWKRVAQSARAATVMAQADAASLQNKLDLAISARSRAEAEKNSAQHALDLADAHSAVVRYAGLHACTASKASTADTAAVYGAAPVDAGASDPPGMAAVSIADLDILASNTVRAESCRALAQAWVEAGIAIVGD